MVRVNTLLLVYAGFLYHIKIVSSIVLDLNDIVNSGLKIHEDSQDGIVTTKIYSTPEKKITKILNGKALVWMALPGEYVKCVNIFMFESNNDVFLSFDVHNPIINKTFYLHKYYNHYKFVRQITFANKIKKLRKRSKRMLRKRKLEDDVDENESQLEHISTGGLISSEDEFDQDNIKLQISSDEEQLDPETIHFEISSDDEPEIEPETITVEIESDDDEREEELTKPDRIEQVMDKLKKMIKQRIKEKSKQSQPSESVPSEESKPSESETTKQPEHTSETTKQTEQTETTDERELQPETIPVEVESDDEHEDIDLEQELLNEPLFGEDVEKLLERELDRTGLSTNELDSVFEEKSKEDDN
ncbi:Tash1-like protein, putative [Theileria annulata]|uniref:Tash1-like protein, putative n=1 Tax=Theileria annulata TaxID=5874 RepID=Q4UHE2_THEAN|nr:Tash1-like protein, putative [Theileria annulata]CAI73497.1 Tash1-like protein, putative [Theileria annulata]|eukprot:XP_954174.1 Tash1-like protein, putative [Theileria annulata]